MSKFIIYGIIFIAAGVGLISYGVKLRAKIKLLRIAKEKERQEQERIRLELAEAKRLKDRLFIESIYPDVLSFNKEFELFLNFKNGYFNNSKLIHWKETSTSIYNNVLDKNLEALELSANVLEEINKFKRNYEEGVILRKDYNQSFIKHELEECKDLFSDIDNASLDHQQRLAIVKDEDHNLVIAGAGSGKTTTVAGKVAYVIDRFNTKPDEILLITFTKKACDEMKDRIRKKMGVAIEVNTFHSFGRKIIGQVTANMPSVVTEDQFFTEMKNIFNSLMTDSNYASTVIKFLTEYKIEAKESDDFNSHGEYINYLKDNNIKSYKTIEKVINGRLTILRETCKSLEEVKIANFLFLNGVNYKYEEPYQHPTSDSVYAQYKPDFYLPDYDIYIEHFGVIDQENNVPHWFSSSDSLSAKEKYNSEMDWKRETHQNHQTNLIETYSYENKTNVLLSNLKTKLENFGVALQPRTSDEIWEILNSIAKDEVSALDTLINTFLNLFKSNNYEISKIKSEINRFDNGEVKMRYMLFLSIFEPIVIRYNSYLRSKNLIDFSDMINQASQYIADNKFENKFKYIIIDEFQDTSIGRFKLIKALLDNNKSCKLFAVGDDWQSIYRFAGSDISLFTDFEKYFGVTEYSKVETTYRFNEKMIDLSSRFILSNPNQTPKQLKPFSVNDIEPIEILQSTSFKNDDPFPVIEALKKINSQIGENDTKPRIIALSRYNHFINLYKERKDLFAVTYNVANSNYIITYLELLHLPIEFLTVHRSKGLQADYVILLNCVSGQYGFPSEQADDPILGLLLSKADRFPNGEERRLFYVALTRSKKKTFIITNSTYKSKFIDEIDPNYIVDPKSKCPICKEGDKVRAEGINKYGKPYIRYTCSNWNFDCDYLEWGK